MPRPDTVGEDHLTDAQYQFIVALIQGQVGIRLPPAKRVMVESRLRRRVRALSLGSVADYATRFLYCAPVPPDELVHLIDCVTTNKTDFFREPAHFEVLRDQIVPEVIGSRDTRRSPLKIWSAAASTGAEAYTIAMVLDDCARRQPLSFDIIGTDISTDVLAQARRGIYGTDMLAPVPAAWRDRYFMRPRDHAREEQRIVPDLRAMVRWGQLNLMDTSYPVDQDVDVIFCRNVLIYFERKVQQQVLSRLVRHLRPGGYLLVGHSESMAGHGQNGMAQVFPTVYRNTSRRVAA